MGPEVAERQIEAAVVGGAFLQSLPPLAVSQTHLSGRWLLGMTAQMARPRIDSRASSFCACRNALCRTLPPHKASRAEEVLAAPLPMPPAGHAPRVCRNTETSTSAKHCTARRWRPTARRQRPRLGPERGDLGRLRFRDSHSQSWRIELQAQEGCGRRHRPVMGKTVEARPRFARRHYALPPRVLRDPAHLRKNPLRLEYHQPWQ